MIYLKPNSAWTSHSYCVVLYHELYLILKNNNTKVMFLSWKYNYTYLFWYFVPLPSRKEEPVYQKDTVPINVIDLLVSVHFMMLRLPSMWVKFRFGSSLYSCGHGLGGQHVYAKKYINIKSAHTKNQSHVPTLTNE